MMQKAVRLAGGARKSWGCVIWRTPSEGQHACHLQLPLGRDWIHWVEVIERKIWVQLKKISLIEQHLTLCQTQSRGWMHVWVDG